MGWPSKVTPYEVKIETWLAEDPKIPSNHVLERLREDGYDGSKTAVYDAVRRLRQHAPQTGVARFEGLPGEFSQHDFGEVWVRYRDGSRERLKFFVSVLKFSRLRRVLGAMIRRYGREPARIHRATGSLIDHYEARRAAGKHDAPELRAVKIYELTWELDPWASNVTQPSHKRLVMAFERVKK